MKRVNKKNVGKIWQLVRKNPKSSLTTLGLVLLCASIAHGATTGTGFAYSMWKADSITVEGQFAVGFSYPAEPTKTVAVDPSPIEETAGDVMETQPPLNGWKPPTRRRGEPDLFYEDKSAQTNLAARHPEEPPSGKAVDWSTVSEEAKQELREAAGFELMAMRIQKAPQPRPAAKLNSRTDQQRSIAHLKPKRNKQYVDVTPKSSKPNLAAPYDPRFPAMVKLEMVYDRDDFTETEHCGGTVINSQWIVTAAHCMQGPEGDDERWDRIEVTVGADMDHPRVRRTAYDVVMHAGFDYYYLSNDIALIRLKEPLPAEVVAAHLDNYRQPSVRSGDIRFAAGWPITGHKAGAKKLQSVALGIKKVEWPGYITAVSPSDGIEGVCRGESGGPIMGVVDGRRQLAGVFSGIEMGTENSHGEPCMKRGYEMYFTPIAAYRDWIDNVLDVCGTTPKACQDAGPTGKFFVIFGGQPTEREPFFLTSQAPN